MSDLVIEPRDGIEVYVNKNGTISMKQLGGYMPEEMFVVVHPDDVDRLIELLQEAREQAQYFEPEPEVDTEAGHQPSA